MEDITTANPIQDKAKELNITPKFLLISLGAILDKKTDVEALKYYIKSLSEDMHHAASRQCKSKNKKSREAGEHALTNLSGIVAEMASHPLLAYLSADNYFNFSEPVKRYQFTAWDYATNQVQRLQKNHLRKYGPNSSFLTIIKDSCSEELLKLKDYAKLFEKDITPN